MRVVSLRAAVALLGHFPALASVHLTVNRGEVVHLQGPNGAGKSTLLHLCAGLQRLTSGAAVVLGCDLGPGAPNHHRAALRRRVGLLGHQTALYDDLTVAENLNLWARMSRVDQATVPATLERVGITHRLASVAVSGLSAGQRRRVGLAAVAVRRPELWLLDEPHASLDRQGRRMVDELVSDAAAAGATVIMASHEPGEASTVATRTVTLTAGTVTNDVAMSSDVD